MTTARTPPSYRSDIPVRVNYTAAGLSSLWKQFVRRGQYYTFKSGCSSDGMLHVTLRRDSYGSKRPLIDNRKERVSYKIIIVRDIREKKNIRW